MPPCHSMGWFFAPPRKSVHILGTLKKRPFESPQIPEVALVVFTLDRRQWVGKSYNNDESVIKPEVHVVQPKLLACMLHFAIIWEISVIKSTFTFAISMHHLEDLFICYGHNQCTTQQISYVSSSRFCK